MINLISALMVIIGVLCAIALYGNLRYGGMTVIEAIRRGNRAPDSLPRSWVFRVSCVSMMFTMWATRIVLIMKADAVVILRSAFRMVGASGAYAARRIQVPRFLPGLWDVLQYLFPQKLRAKVYEPGRLELEQDFYRARQFRKPWKRLVLTGVFTCRTVMLVMGTWRVGIASKVLPKRLRDWWTA